MQFSPLIRITGLLAHFYQKKKIAIEITAKTAVVNDEFSDISHVLKFLPSVGSILDFESLPKIACKHGVESVLQSWASLIGYPRTTQLHINTP